MAPNGGHIVAIAESFEDKASMQSLEDVETCDYVSSGINQPSLRLARNKTISPRREVFIVVHTTENSRFTVQSLLHKPGESQSQVKRGVVKALPNQAFCIVVVNASKSSVTYPKNMKVGQLMEEPSTIVPLGDALSVGFVNVTQTYRGIHNTEQQFDQHQHLTTNENEKQEVKWRDQSIFIKEYI